MASPWHTTARLAAYLAIIAGTALVRQPPPAHACTYPSQARSVELVGADDGVITNPAALLIVVGCGPECPSFGDDAVTLVDAQDTVLATRTELVLDHTSSNPYGIPRYAFHRLVPDEPLRVGVEHRLTVGVAGVSEWSATFVVAEPPGVAAELPGEIVRERSEASPLGAGSRTSCVRPSQICWWPPESPLGVAWTQTTAAHALTVGLDTSGYPAFHEHFITRITWRAPDLPADRTMVLAADDPRDVLVATAAGEHCASFEAVPVAGGKASHLGEACFEVHEDDVQRAPAPFPDECTELDQHRTRYCDDNAPLCSGDARMSAEACADYDRECTREPREVDGGIDRESESRDPARSDAGGCTAAAHPDGGGAADCAPGALTLGLAALCMRRRRTRDRRA